MADHIAIGIESQREVLLLKMNCFVMEFPNTPQLFSTFAVLLENPRGMLIRRAVLITANKNYMLREHTSRQKNMVI